MQKCSSCFDVAIEIVIASSGHTNSINNIATVFHPTENDEDECFLGSVTARDAAAVSESGAERGVGAGGKEAATERVCSLGGGEPADDREG